MAFVIMASIAIPYSARTCSMDSEVNISFITQNDTCCIDKKELSVREAYIEKPSCCVFDNGLIDIDVELVSSSLNTFIPYLPTQILNFELRKEIVNSTQTFPLIVALNSSFPPIRIMQQSFLC